MKVGVIAHGALLAASLGFAYQTWTREKTEEPKAGTVTVWNKSVADFEAFAFDGENKSIRVEKRKDDQGDYYWGQVTRQKKAPKPKSPVKGEPEKPADDEHGHGGLPKGVPGMPGAHGLPPRPGMPPAPGAPAPGKSTTPASPAKPAAPAPGKPAAPAPARPAAPAGGAPAKAPQSPHYSQPTPPGGGGDEHGEDGPIDTPDDDGGGSSMAPAADETVTTTREFPIGSDGVKLIEQLAHLRALRDLGKLSDQQKEEYELTDSKENLTVFFAGGEQHSLLVGGRVFGGSDRYVLDTDSGKGYVLSNSEIMRHVDSAETSLGLKVLHAFQEDLEEPAAPLDPKAPKPKKDVFAPVGKIQVEAPSGTRELVRAQSTDPKGGVVTGWTAADKPGPPDLTFANFLTQVDRLKPTEYDPSLAPATLTKVLTLRYSKPGGGDLGTFELYKKENVSPEVTPAVGPEDKEEDKKEGVEYYVHTELTRVLGKVSKMAAERVEGDVPQLFGAAPAPKDDKKGAKKEPGKPVTPAPVKPTAPAPKDAKPAGSPAPPTPGNK
jgi:hypothetical protein